MPNESSKSEEPDLLDTL
ncbi:hypothetical protein D047_3383A, partial [Vibrio parahaemolyticus VPTS-2010_2]